MSPEKYGSLSAKVELAPLSGMTLKPSNPLVLVLSLAWRAFVSASTSNMEKHTKSFVSHQKSWGVLEILVKMLGIYCTNQSHTKTIVIRIKIICSKWISKTDKKESLSILRTVMTGTRISEQKAFSQLRRLSRVWRRMSWSFPGEYGEKWEHWAITNKLDSKKERDTEFLYNMLNSFFSLINE